MSKLHYLYGRNRRGTSHRSHLALIPLEKLFSGRNDILVYKEKSNSVDTLASDDPFEHMLDNPLVVTLPQRRPGPDDPHWKIHPSEWGTVLRRIEQGESLRTVAKDYHVSFETVRRVIRAAHRL